ncbi:unnamed protein product [Schistocephalus solidus]|uniref:N-acetyltransferase domain-containing protein n=1 Tax=Schistocephalus solidus TaxID=70667 RepID=A0A183SX80_SCHSO|nr:unnamed protein product [Schistocephalus solidus]
MIKPCQRAYAVNAHSALICLVGHLRTQYNNNPTTSTSATPASDSTTMMTTPTTDNHLIYTQPPTITDTILPPPPLAPIWAMNTTCPTPPPQWPPLTTCYLQHHCHPQYQRWGLGTNLSSL